MSVEGEEAFLAGLEVEEEVEDYLEALLREGEVHIEGEENQYLIVRDWPSRRKRKILLLVLPDNITYNVLRGCRKLGLRRSFRQRRSQCCRVE